MQWLYLQLRHRMDASWLLYEVLAEPLERLIKALPIETYGFTTIKTKSYTQLTDFEGQDIQPEWGSNNTLYYLSAQNGRYNIYKQQLDANGKAQGSATAMTNYKDEGIRFFDVSGDGNHIVFEKGISLYIMNADGKGKPKKLNFQVSEDYRFYPVEHKTFTNQMRNYDVSPDGKYMTFVVRGEIFVKPMDKDKKRAAQITRSSL